MTYTMRMSVDVVDVPTVADYLAGHTRGRLGRIEYRATDLGLDRDDLRARSAPYVERFVR